MGWKHFIRSIDPFWGRLPMTSDGDERCTTEIMIDGHRVKFVYLISAAWVDDHFVSKQEFGSLELKALNRWHQLTDHMSESH